MTTSLAGKTQTENQGSVAGLSRRRGWLERALNASRSLAWITFVALPAFSGVAAAQQQTVPPIQPPARQTSVVMPAQYVQNGVPLPGQFVKPPALPEATHVPDLPLTTAPPSMVDGPVAGNAPCGSTGRNDFFPFEFNRNTVRFDALWFRRDANGSQLLANGVVNATGQAFALDTETDLDIRSLNPGGRVYFEQAIGDCTSYVNSSFMWFQKMNTGTTLDNNAGITITRGAGGFGFAATTHQDTIYDTVLYGADINYREDFGTFSLLFGTRFLHIEENLQISELGVFNDPFRGQILTNAGRNTFTYNDMIGLQFGFDYNWEVGRFITISSVNRAAIMANYSGYRINQGVGDSFQGPFVRTNRNSTSNLAGIFEVGVVGTVRLTEHASLRGGYQMLYVPGIANAMDQFIPDLFGQDTSDVDRKGTAVFYGPFVGLEIRWGLCE